MRQDARRLAVIFGAAGMLGGAILTTGCAKARASHEPEPPALAMPAPPARVLPPLEGGPIEAATPEQLEVPEQPRPPVRHRGDGTRAEATRAAAREDQAKADLPVPDAATTPPEQTPAEPVTPALQLAPSPDAASEQGIKRKLSRANADLGQVDYRVLNDDAKAQYETAKRFIELAEQSIRDRNLVFAQTLADKAEAIAEVLKR